MTFATTAPDTRVTYRGLRGWLDEVQNMGELLHVNGAHWDVEMGAITHMLTEKSDGTAPAILFDEVPGYPKGFRTLYGHFSSIRRVAEAAFTQVPRRDRPYRLLRQHRHVGRLAAVALRQGGARRVGRRLHQLPAHARTVFRLCRSLAGRRQSRFPRMGSGNALFRWLSAH